MILLKYLEPIVYVFAFSLVVAAALIIYNLQFIENKIVYRLRLKAYLKEQADKVRKNLHNETLEKLLISTGNPLNLDSVKYNFIRISLLGGWLLYTNFWWLLNSDKYPYHTIGLILALFILTQPCENFPIHSLLLKLNDLKTREMNKECFSLYSMIQNEFYTDIERPLNMYSTLKKLRPYFKAIDKAIGKALILWKKNPSEALDSFAAEIGSEEANDLAQILKNIDSSSPWDARDILDSRYDQFVTKRHENYRRYRNNIGLIGYIAALLPVFAIIYNAMIIFNLEKQQLLKFIYQK